jgi:endonuclease/exonuclease/phosphatase family metal-dependent hydrolase
LGLLALAFLAGCDFDQVARELAQAPPADPPSASAPLPTPSAPSAPEPSIPAQPAPELPQAARPLAIASYNIQVFGTSKMAKPEVVAILADVVRRHDLVAIQEIRSKDETVLPQFVAKVNSAGRRYDYVIGPRLGRTTSKEQYAFVFDTDRLELVPGSAYTVPDPQDLLHREPLVASFRARGLLPEQAFSFTLINIHTDPDEVDTEVDALADVYQAVRQASPEDDVILLGDLNADAAHLGRLAQVPGIAWIINGQPTNTRGTASYDNILFAPQATAEYAGYAGVLDVAADYRLTPEQALAVSDHLPVWAAFQPAEAPRQLDLARQPEPAVR